MQDRLYKYLHGDYQINIYNYKMINKHHYMILHQLNLKISIIQKKNMDILDQIQYGHLKDLPYNQNLLLQDIQDKSKV